MDKIKKIILISIYCIVCFILPVKAETIPVIKSLNPSSASAGDEIAIIGEKFGSEQGTGKVLFYKNKEAKIISWKDNEIICLVPQKAKSGNVIVYNNENKKSKGIKFRILTGVLPIPKNLKTENIATNTATLKWDKVEKSKGYIVSIGTDEQATGLKNVNLATNIYDMADLRPGTKYYWKVKALGSEASKNSGWSRVVSFEIKKESPPVQAPTAAEKNNKSKTLSLIILTVVIFGILFSAFILIRFLLKRKKMGSFTSEEPSLNIEPEESSLEHYGPSTDNIQTSLSNQPPLPNEIYPPKPSLNDISQPSTQQNISGSPSSNNQPETNLENIPETTSPTEPSPDFSSHPPLSSDKSEQSYPSSEQGFNNQENIEGTDFSFPDNQKNDYSNSQGLEFPEENYPINNQKENYNNLSTENNSSEDSSENSDFSSPQRPIT